MSGSKLFDPLFGPSVGDDELVQAMLEVEAALARVGAAAGVIPAADASAIVGCCVVDRFDIAALGAGTRLAGNPVIPLVLALTAMLPEPARRSVHVGATSQDILDSALMLVAARRRARIEGALRRAGDAAAALAETHRSSIMAGRTLLQHALPITFGLKSAHWLVGIHDAVKRLDGCALPLQFGGAAGTLASLGSPLAAATRNLTASAPDELAADGRVSTSAARVMSAAMAHELGLTEPTMSWHTESAPMVGLGAALAMACGSLAKIAVDVELLMQTEVAEAFEARAPGKGGSSTLPHKRNPVASVAIRAAHQQASSLAGGLIAAMAHEHERAAGGWHATWEPLLNLLRLTEGAALHGAEMLEELEVDPVRMRANLALSGGRVVAEAVVTALRPRLGRAEAEAVVKRASALTGQLADNLPTAIANDSAVVDALDPSNYLGSAYHFIDQALEIWRTS